MTPEQRKMVEDMANDEPDHVARYEAMAEDFYRETGFMAPGKSMPPVMNVDEVAREMAWTGFQKRRAQQHRAALRAVLAVADGKVARAVLDFIELDGAEAERQLVANIVGVTLAGLQGIEGRGHRQLDKMQGWLARVQNERPEVDDADARVGVAYWEGFIDGHNETYDEVRQAPGWRGEEVTDANAAVVSAAYRINADAHDRAVRAVTAYGWAVACDLVESIDELEHRERTGDRSDARDVVRWAGALPAPADFIDEVG